VKLKSLIIFKKLNGFEPTSVHMKVSFGKNQTAWNNSGYETDLVRRLRPEVNKKKFFQRVLIKKIINSQYLKLLKDKKIR